MIDDHRRWWPAERIAAEPDAYREESEKVMARMRGEHPNWPDRFWIELLFEDALGDAA